MNTLQEQYNLITEGKGNKAQFLKNAKFQFPNLFNAFTSYEDAANVLKSKGLISEGIGGVVTGGVEQDWVKIFKDNITEEVKAEEKKTSKEVEDVLAHNFDYKDDKNIDNVYGQSFLHGFYTEMQDPKNEDKTVDEVKEIVRKNLAKDRLHYTKDGMFGIKGLGYTEEAPGLGPTKEVAGKYKSSGMEPVKLREAYEHSQKDWYKTVALKIFQELKERYTEDELDKALEKYVEKNGADLKKIDKAKVIDKLKGYDREKIEEAKKKPSTGLTKKEKSTISKKAHAGKDIGKKGKGFEKVAKAAEKQYGSKEAGEKVAAAAMWKSQAKKKMSESQALKEEIFNLFKKKGNSGEINVKENPLLTPERAERLADILLIRIADDNTPQADKKYYVRQYERLRNQMPKLNLHDPAQDVEEGATEYIGPDGAEAIKTNPAYRNLPGDEQQNIQTSLKTNKRTAVA